MNRVLVVWLALVVSGCATVRPWEREDLARPAMRVGGDPDENARMDHTLAAREGSMPAGVGRGGGCGCN